MHLVVDKSIPANAGRPRGQILRFPSAKSSTVTPLAHVHLMLDKVRRLQEGRLLKLPRVWAHA